MTAVDTKEPIAGSDNGDLAEAPAVVEIRRNAVLAAVLGVLAAGVAIAYLMRAVQLGSWLSGVVAVLLTLLAAGFFAALLDARGPLLVADRQGVRLRLGRSWTGLPWSALREIEHEPRRHLLGDGYLVLVPHNPERVLGALDARSRWQTVLARWVYGDPLAVPLGPSTKLLGARESELSTRLQELAGEQTDIVDIVGEEALDESDPADEAEGTQAGEQTDPVAETPRAAEPAEAAHAPRTAEESPDATSKDAGEPAGDPARTRIGPRPWLAGLVGAIADRLPRHRPDTDAASETADSGDPGHHVPDPAPVEASETPEPGRAARAAARGEMTMPVQTMDEPPSGRELRRAGSVTLVEETQAWAERFGPAESAPAMTEPVVLPEVEAPTSDPVIGPQLAAARVRLALTVDQLAERTRIRPHVIESIEVDDFEPCGGDFYARGHLRTLARVLGVDVAPLLATFEDRYSQAPIDAKKIFEAELATGDRGTIRSTRGGPNWSVLVAAVMALVLCWSVARLVMDGPEQLRETALNGSGGVSNGRAEVKPVPVTVTAAGGGAHVIVRDSLGATVFTGDLAFGETKSIKATPPVRVQSSDGGVVVVVDGVDKGPMGKPGEESAQTYITE